MRLIRARAADGALDGFGAGALDLVLYDATFSLEVETGIQAFGEHHLGVHLAVMRSGTHTRASMSLVRLPHARSSISMGSRCKSKLRWMSLSGVSFQKRAQKVH